MPSFYEVNICGPHPFITCVTTSVIKCNCLRIVIPTVLKWLSCVQRHIEEPCLLTRIIYFLQETSLLLGNLVDVLEEVKLAKMELLNLTSAAFVLESQTCVLSISSTFYLQVLVWFCHEALILKCFLTLYITHRMLGSHPYVRQWDCFLR
jgi:hypothetical protein